MAAPADPVQRAEVAVVVIQQRRAAVADRVLHLLPQLAGVKLLQALHRQGAHLQGAGAAAPVVVARDGVRERLAVAQGHLAVLARRAASLRAAGAGDEVRRPISRASRS
jgi:hypothetical protein